MDSLFTWVKGYRLGAPVTAHVRAEVRHVVNPSTPVRLTTGRVEATVIELVAEAGALALALRGSSRGPICCWPAVHGDASSWC